MGFKHENPFIYPETEIEAMKKFEDGKFEKPDKDRSPETEEVFIPDLSSFVGRPMREVEEYIQQEYGLDYVIAGQDYLDFLKENPTKVPEELRREDVWYHFFLHTGDNGLGVPCIRWRSWGQGSFQPLQTDLVCAWPAYGGVILLKK